MFHLSRYERCACSTHVQLQRWSSIYCRRINRTCIAGCVIENGTLTSGKHMQGYILITSVTSDGANYIINYSK